jgi:uncharacterized protein YjbI with pentapeptide repeats
MQEIITQKQFLEMCKQGKKEFSDILLQFIDISNVSFKDTTIKNSKLLFCTFRNCNFSNMIMENCKIYCGSYYNCKIKSVFLKCKIELTLFESVQFDKTEMKKCSIRLCAIFNSNANSVDYSTSEYTRLLTDPSQITRQDLDDTINETMSEVNRLDLGTRMKLKEILRQDMERYNLKGSENLSSSYSAKSDQDGNSNFSYGEIRQLIESTFGSYAEKKPYEMKKPYQREEKYR